MTNHRTIQPDARKVIVGVDTHKHVHVAGAIDTRGVRLDDRSCAADSDGYQQLITWAERHGRIAAFGIEGAGSYGAGRARAVRRAGHQVLEVNRGDRRTRRIAGKSDPVDAETAARAVLAGQSTAIPKTGVGARMRAGLRASNCRARHLPMRYETGLPSSVIRFRTLHASTASRRCPDELRARRQSPTIDVYRKNAFSTRAC